MINTEPNSKALCALPPSGSGSRIAYPSAKVGELDVYDLGSLSVLRTIEAHDSPLSCFAFNTEGTLIATASSKVYLILPYCIASFGTDAISRVRLSVCLRRRMVRRNSNSVVVRCLSRFIAWRSIQYRYFWLRLASQKLSTFSELRRTRVPSSRRFFDIIARLTWFFDRSSYKSMVSKWLPAKLQIVERSSALIRLEEPIDSRSLVEI